MRIAYTVTGLLWLAAGTLMFFSNMNGHVLIGIIDTSISIIYFTLALYTKKEKQG